MKHANQEIAVTLAPEDRSAAPSNERTTIHTLADTLLWIGATAGMVVLSWMVGRNISEPQTPTTDRSPAGPTALAKRLVTNGHEPA